MIEVRDKIIIINAFFGQFSTVVYRVTKKYALVTIERLVKVTIKIKRDKAVYPIFSSYSVIKLS